MSTIALNRLPPEVREHPPVVLTMDDRRGTGGMWLFIATEGFLFLMFFVAYFYLAQGGWNWPGEKPPDVKLAILMLVVLLASSAVLHWGEKEVKKREYGRGQAAIAITLLLAAGFLTLSFFDYRHHLKDLGPTTDSYGSIFYTITSFHLAHLVIGMMMLGYVFILPVKEPADRPPHRPYHNASLYWHFVDFIWIWIVLILYLSPHLR